MSGNCKKRPAGQPYQLPPITVNWEDVKDDGKVKFFEERLAYDDELDVLHIRFSFDFILGMEEINRPIHLLRWLDYLSTQHWFRIEFVGPLIQKVCWIKDWNLFRA